MSLWQTVRQNSGLADDPNWRQWVIRWSLVSLLLIGVTAYNSYGFFKFDEHYQIVEFVGYKLGKTPENQLAWEYRSQIRPWLQPAMYYTVAKALIGLGVENPFKLATAFRVVSGLIGWLAIVSLMLSANVLFGAGRRRRLAVMLLALLWLIPYLAVRTSAESLSGDFFTLGVAVLLLGSTPAEPETTGRSRLKKGTGASPQREKQNNTDTSLGASPLFQRPVRGRRRFLPAAALIAGVCFGLSFEFRFQIAFAVLGVLGWVVYSSADGLRQRIGKLALLCSGGLAMVAIGAVIDRWGYGVWTFVPWNLIHVDVLQGRPSLDGVQPMWWYFLLMFVNPAAPITFLWTVAMVVTWVRFPRHILTWATLPFFVGHSLVPHKELRYLFPLAMLGTFFFVIALVPASEARRRPAWLTALWSWRRSGWAKALVAVNFLGLAYVCFVTHEPSLNFQRFLYNHYPHGCTLYVLGEKTRSPFDNVGAMMYFYRPPNFTFKRLRDDDELATILQRDAADCLVVRDRLGNWSPPDSAPAEAQLIYKTYPAWVEQYNYFNWLQNSKRFNLYAVKPTSSGALPTALRGHANDGDTLR